MHITETVQWVKEKAERAAAEAEEFAAQHLPLLADLATKAEANPLVDAALSVVHVSPEILSGMAGVLMKLDADLAALQPAPAPEPEPVPGQPAA